MEKLEDELKRLRMKWVESAGISKNAENEKRPGRPDSSAGSQSIKVGVAVRAN